MPIKGALYGAFYFIYGLHNVYYIVIMYKKISLIFIAFVVLVSSFAGLLVDKTFADEPSAHPFYPNGIVDAGKKAAFANMFWGCFKVYRSDETSRKYSISGAEIGETQFQNNDEQMATVGAITEVEKGDGRMSCSNINSTFLSSMGALGFSNRTPREVYCDMDKLVSGTVATTGACPASTGTGNPLDIVNDNAATALFKKAESIQGHIQYYIGYKTLVAQCGVTDAGVRSKDDGHGGEGYYDIGIVKNDGTIETHAYQLANANSEVTFWNTTGANGWAHVYQKKCKDFLMETLGPSKPATAAYAAYVKSQIKSSPDPSACDNKYKTELEKSACRDGASHKNDPKYCDTKYPPSDPDSRKANAACKHGQGTTAGGSSGGTTTLPGGSTIEEDPAAAATGTEGEEDQENCKIDNIGWIVCPIVNTLASMSEGARAKLVDMLTVDAKSILGDTSEGSVYSYWSKIRDYANILFVVFFLFVIYSQMTGYGLDNYGIKRMLPKLIVGVIVVNASFYICGLLVDLSNVVGSSAFNFISTTAVGDIPAGDWSNSDSSWINKIAAGALVLTVGYFALATVISMLLFVVITAVTTIFLLGVREAIIILCIVLSPLAFVAMIMPNTEGLYKKWWGAFKAALMVYPMVGLVYGASNLAAKILGSSVSESDIIMQSIVALLVFVPLLIVPKLIRGAVEIIGIGGAIAFAEKWMNKGRDRMSDRVGKWRENKLTSQFAKHRREKAQLRRAQIQGGTYQGRGGIANLRNWRSAANRRFNARSGDFGQKRKLIGSMAVLEEDKERMKAASAWIADNNMSSSRLAEIATGKDKDGNDVDLKGISSYQRRAAMQALAPHMTSEQAANLATASASFGDASLQKEAADAIAQSGAKKAPWVGGKQLEAIRQGTYNEQEAMSDYIQNKASGQGLANADANAVNKMVKFAEDEARHNADSSYMRSLMRARADLEADPKTAGGISSAVRQEIERIPPMQRQSNSGGGRNQGGGGQGGSGGSGSGGGGGGQGGSGGGGGNPTPRGGTPKPNGGGGAPPNPGGSGSGGSSGGSNGSSGGGSGGSPTPRPNGGGGAPPNPGGSGSGGNPKGDNDSGNDSSKGNDPRRGYGSPPPPPDSSGSSSGGSQGSSSGSGSGDSESSR